MLKMKNTAPKKIFSRVLTATVLGSVLGLSGTAYAEAVAPSLKISGNTIMNVYVVKQKVKDNGKGKSPHFANDIADLFFLISGKTASGIEYKYRIQFQAFANSHPTVKQNYVEFGTKFGIIQFGNVVGPEDSMIRDGGAIAGGTGGFDGGYNKVFNLSALTMRGNDNIGDTGESTKIVYYSPQFYNIRIGIAYTPDTTHLGDEAMNGNSTKGNHHAPGQRTFFPKTSNGGVNVIGQNNWAFGVMYDKMFGNFGVNVNGAYVMDRSYLASTNKTLARLKVRNTSAYQLGMVLGYRLESGNLIQLGGGYLNNNRSRLMKTQLGNNAANYGFVRKGDGNLSAGNSGKAWNVAAGITMGAYKFTTGFQETSRKTDAKDKTRNQMVFVTADVVPVQGLKFYTEVDYIHSRSNANAVKLCKLNVGKNSLKDAPNKRNQGVVATVGTKISF